MGLPIKPFELFRYPWDTNKGLVYYSIWWIIFLGFLYLKFKDSFHYLFLSWVIILSIYIIAWIVKRENYFYFSKKLHIVFAITLDFEDRELMKRYDELINNFREKLKDYNLAKNIHISKN